MNNKINTQNNGKQLQELTSLTKKDMPLKLNSLDNSKLILELKSLVSEERKLLSSVLDYLLEVQTRRLYLELGFPSLFEFCVKELQYSESAAQRRISAARLMKDIPEVKTKIEKGNLNLTTLSQAAMFIGQEKRVNQKSYNINQKRELLGKLENKSKSECEKELIKISPLATIPKERERLITEEKIEVRFVITKELKEKLERVKALISHKKVNPSYEELLSELAEIALNKLDKSVDRDKKGNKEMGIIKDEQVSNRKDQCQKALPPAEVKNPDAQQVGKESANSRYIPTTIKRQVWKRDQGKCQYVSDKNFNAGKHENSKNQKDNAIDSSAQKCNSTHFIQIDHIIPFSHGGSSTDINNLRLLCANHNRYRWEKRT
ncbi:MAG: HNH endonuclease [Oligoflexia bacterium]|nr:HNH endonuclease [Oligoflexia bacterium]